MLPKVSVHRFTGTHATNVERYRRLVGDELIDEILSLVNQLRGVRICHLNSTGFGGGVAELLARYVPLGTALGLDADWRLLQGTAEFFTITKAFHNALQGAAYSPSDADKALYQQVNLESSKLLDVDYDVYVVHDPQPAAFRAMAGPRNAKWIWRCHIDTAAPNTEVATFLLPFLQLYDAVIVTMPQFLLPGLDPDRVSVISPAIDAFSTKNMELPDELCREVVANAGVDPSRPLVVQVSRFDPWKDPLGVVKAYRLARREVPGLQLALIGAIAGDDPEGWQLLAEIEEEAANDPDLFVFTNLAGVGSMEVNAFQRSCDLVIQKSLREGFGLVVSEAFWKRRAVVAGRAGGIPQQFPPGYARYLIDTVDECAARIVELTRAPALRTQFGRAAHDHVRRHFLLPRLLRDDLRAIQATLAG